MKKKEESKKRERKKEVVVAAVAIYPAKFQLCFLEVRKYETPNKHDPSQHDPIELTDGFRLLGLPVGNREFTIVRTGRTNQNFKY